MAFTSEQISIMDSIIARYPRKRSAIMPLLHYVQSIDGYVTNEGIELIRHLIENVSLPKMGEKVNNNYQDLENLITEQREKINSLALQQRQLDDPQVFEELVQEVMRKINELNSEEIRSGSSFKARSESFGKPNSDYLGNNLLSIFTNTDQARLENVQKAVEEKMQEKETPIEIAEIQAEEIGSPTQRIIDELLELSEFETPREKKKTMRIIEDLRELMEFE